MLILPCSSRCGTWNVVASNASKRRDKEACIGRARVDDAIEEADVEEVEVLRDEELPKLHAAVDLKNASEVQRYNIVILGYRTGLRADTLEKFLVDCFNLKVTDNGEMLTPVFANMKNLAASLTKIDKALFKLQIVQCIDEWFCAIATFKRQLKLLEDVGEVERNYLFRTSHFWSKTRGTKKSSADTSRGAAIWVSKVLGRHITFKDIARRVAMTKLANDPNISSVDAAKYLGVQVRTPMVYHRKDKESIEKGCPHSFALP